MHASAPVNVLSAAEILPCLEQSREMLNLVLQLLVLLPKSFQLQSIRL
jgi:hypothetical protein